MKTIVAEDIVDEGVHLLYKELGPVKTIKFFQLIGAYRDDTLKEIEEKTSKMSKKEALDLINKVRRERKDLWKDVGLV